MSFDAENPPTLADSSDVELYREVQLGQQRSLGLLYDRYSSLVYRLALRILTNPQEAEDLTQDVFIQLWQRQAYQPERGSLGSFLTTLTRSRAIDRLRSRQSKVRFLNQWSQFMTEESQSLLPFELADLAQRSESVQAALTQLSEKQRLVLELSYYEGLSQSEIAHRLEAPLGTVKSWSRQGLLTLRKALQASFADR